LQDENVDLKLKVTELQSELLDERQKKEIRFDKTIETFKHNIEGDYFDIKVKFEERIMQEKEINHKLRLEMQTMNEKNLRLGLQLRAFVERSEKLEKENMSLQSNLDREALQLINLRTEYARVASKSPPTRETSHKISEIAYREGERCKSLEKTLT
jgi:hypothetical protein